MPANLRPRRVAALVVVLAACVALPASLSAQTYLVLHSLSVSSGNSPQSSLVQDAGGKLYGTAALSGAHGSGSIFKLDTNGDNFVDIHDFDNTDGANPYGGVILGGGGFLFGTAANGGNDDAGVVYKIDTSGNNFAVIHHLDGGNDGSHPFGGLAQGSDTILYGVAHDDRSNGFGTGFSIDPGSTEPRPAVSRTASARSGASRRRASFRSRPTRAPRAAARRSPSRGAASRTRRRSP